mgnify:CR=1 FL=1
MRHKGSLVSREHFGGVFAPRFRVRWTRRWGVPDKHMGGIALVHARAIAGASLPRGEAGVGEDAKHFGVGKWHA